VDYKTLIEEKQLQKSALMNQIREIEAEIIAIKAEKEYEKTGLKIGDIVENQKGVRGVLSSYSGYSWNWFKLKKDGTPSKSETYVYDISGCHKVEGEA